MNVINEIQKILDDIEEIFEESYFYEKKEELELAYKNIQKEYPNLSDIDFKEENKDRIKNSLENIFEDIDNKDSRENNSLGDTNYFLDKSFRNMRYRKENFRVINIVRDYLDGTFVIPDFQRKYIWTRKQVSELIVSFILGIPVPTLYGYSEFDESDSKQKFYIIDGQQRLTSILFYYYGVFPKSIKNRKKYDYKLFKLCDKRKNLKKEIEEGDNSKIEELNEIENQIKKGYSIQLDISFQTRYEENGKIVIKNLDLNYLEKEELRLKNVILGTTLEATMIEGFETIDSLATIFHIYNSKGKNLTEDEIRKSLYHKNYLYTKLSQYCININKKKSLKIKSSFDLFNSTDAVVSEKKLFQLLSYYFNLTKKYNSNENWYKDNSKKLNEYLTNEIKSKELVKEPLDKNYKGKKIDDLITEYSKYVAKEGDKIAKEEYETIKRFFELNFEKTKTKKGQYSFKNLICNYILVRHFNLFDQKNLIINNELLTVSVNGFNGTLEAGRLKQIYNIYKQRGYING